MFLKDDNLSCFCDTVVLEDDIWGNQARWYKTVRCRRRLTEIILKLKLGFAMISILGR